MITNLDIYRSASVLLRRYGDGASLHAANRVYRVMYWPATMAKSPNLAVYFEQPV